MKVAVLGYGTVGYGVYEMLKNAEGLEAGPVLVRPGKDDEPFKVTSIDDIVNDKSVDAVAEVMGGVEPAFTYVSKALEAGKHVVTSNKALVSEKGIELEAIAKRTGAAFLFSAACGGAVPFLHNIALAVKSDTINSISGILNGTTNYMLDAMQRRSMSYESALADAQKLGYAEADPTADVTGLDALRKIMLGCAVAYGKLPSEGLLNEGIDSFTSADVDYLRSEGLTCRLIVSGGENDDGSIYAFVEPVLFESDAPECSVLNNFNMASYNARNAGDIIFMGQGAGRWPTASAVIRDLSDILCGQRFMLSPECVRVCADNSKLERSYLVRVSGSVFPELKELSRCEYGGNTYIKTAPVSVAGMHAAAAKARKEGGKIFFASVK